MRLKTLFWTGLATLLALGVAAQPTTFAPASQTEVNAGVVRTKFVSPATLGQAVSNYVASASIGASTNQNHVAAAAGLLATTNGAGNLVTLTLNSNIGANTLVVTNGNFQVTTAGGFVAGAGGFLGNTLQINLGDAVVKNGSVLATNKLVVATPGVTNSTVVITNGGLFLPPNLYGQADNYWAGEIAWGWNGQDQPPTYTTTKPAGRISVFPNWGGNPYPEYATWMLITCPNIRLEEGWTYGHGAVHLGNEEAYGNIDVNFAPGLSYQSNVNVTANYNGISHPLGFISAGTGVATNSYYARPGIVGMTAGTNTSRNYSGYYAGELLFSSLIPEGTATGYYLNTTVNYAITNVVAKMHTNSWETFGDNVVSGGGRFIGNGSGLTNLNFGSSIPRSNVTDWQGFDRLPKLAAKLSAIRMGYASNAIIAHIGDSWTTPYTYSWQIMSNLWCKYGNAGAGYYCPATNTLPAGNGPATTYGRSGVWVDSSYTNFSPNLTMMVSTDAATPATISITNPAVSTFVVHYWAGAGLGSFAYRVDGGAWTTNATAAASTTYSNATVAAGASGSHNLQIKVASGEVRLFGVDLQSTNAGVRFHNTAQAGSAASDWTSCASNLWATGLALLNPDTCVIRLGVNDALNGATVAQYAANLIALCGRVRGVLTNADIVIMSPSDIGAATTYPISSYVAAMELIARTNGYAFLDMYSRYGDYAKGNALGLYANTTHINELGDQDAAKCLTDVLTGDDSFGTVHVNQFNAGSLNVLGSVHTLGTRTYPNTLTVNSNACVGINSPNPTTAFLDIYTGATPLTKTIRMGYNSAYGNHIANAFSGSSNASNMMAFQIATAGAGSVQQFAIDGAGTAWANTLTATNNIVSTSGQFSGNGGGLTNIPLTAIARFSTSSIPISPGLVKVAAHGLSATPTSVRLVLVCTNADGSFAVNDEAPASQVYNAADASWPAFSWGANSSNIWISQFGNLNGIGLQSKTDGSAQTLVTNYWTLKLYAQ